MKEFKRKNKFIPLFFKFVAKSFIESSNTLGNFLNTFDSLKPQFGSLYQHPIPIYPLKLNKKGLHNLKNRGLISFNDKEIRITNEGRIWFKKSYLQYMRYFYPKWDKKWRVVIFDIPQELHKNRNRFRQKLKSLGFFILQKSVFVFPYPCEIELSEICSKLKVSDYVDIITASSVGFRESEIKRVFNLP